MNALQTIIDALALGAIYAVVAVGIALIFGVMRIVNFAQGELITAAAYALALTGSLPPVVSILIAIAVSIALAFAIERTAVRPLRSASPTTTLISTFAVAMLLQAVWLLAFGPQGKSVNTLASLSQPATSGALHIRWITIVSIGVVALIIAALGLFLRKTKIGLHMRAAASDVRTARLLGVRADRVISLTFVLAGASSAVAAVLLTVSQPLVSPEFGLQVMIIALVGSVAGGIDRLPTATLGAFLIGFATSVLGSVLPSGSRVFLTSFVFLLVILVLLARPAGLFAPFRPRTVDRV